MAASKKLIMHRVTNRIKRIFGVRTGVQYLRDQRAYSGYDVGTWSYGTPNVLFDGPESTLSIGKYCSIAAGTTIFLGGDHFHDRLSTFPFAEMLPGASDAPQSVKTKGPVEIGHDVWIGREAMILSGNLSVKY